MKDQKRKKKIFQRCMGGLLACLMLLCVPLEPLSAAGVTLMETRQTVESYERMNPVGWQQVELGTPEEELELPDSLRAIVPLSDVDMDYFEQAQPQADLSSGSESYDYYYYGYVAPKDKEKLYENGDLAVYTIYYAAEGEASMEVASEAYRVYGSLNGGENSWYACEEDGTITGQVQDVRMSWDTSGYDSENPDIYEITGKAEGYSVECDDAVITVEVSGDVVVEDTEKTPDTEDNTNPEKKEETTDTGLEVSEEAAEVGIVEFEQSNPVVSLMVAEGTEKEELTLPTELKAVISLDKLVDDTAFSQENPSAEELEESGYRAPENEEELRQSEQKVLYTFEDAEEVQKETKNDEVEKKSCRVYGSLNGEAAAWYACDEEGTITGRVQTVEVTWNTEAYDANMPAVYRIEGEVVTDYPINAENPYAIVTVQDMDCICDLVPDSRPWEHGADCPKYEPVQCMCDGEHDETNRDCPLYGSDVVEICRPDGETKILARMEDLDIFQEKGFVIPEEPVVHYAVSPLSTNGGGTIDNKQDAYMRANSPTSGPNTGMYRERNSNSVPWSWVYYLNTVWMNKGYAEFSWAQSSATKWNGGVEPVGVTASTGYIEVYTPGQLRYALVNCKSGDMIRLRADINLNGSEQAWSPIIRPEIKNVTLWAYGGSYSIYNLGIYTADTDGSKLNRVDGMYCQGAVFVDLGQGTFYHDLKFYNAKIVTYRGTDAENNNWENSSQCLDSRYISGSLFGRIGDERLNNIYVKDSLLYGGPWTAFIFNQGVAYSKYATDTSYASNTYYNYINNCFLDSCMIYGVYHVGGIGNMPHKMKISNSYVKDSLIVAIGMDVGGFTSCTTTTTATYNQCFVSNTEIYANGYAGGFIGYTQQDTFTNCFSSGIVAGYFECGGFVGRESCADTNAEFANCYTTALVGLQDGTIRSGGFVGKLAANGTGTVIMKNCYAAGEVGDYTMDMDHNGTNNGGYVGVLEIANANDVSYTYCYYDKQTTAMREWTTGSSKVTDKVALIGGDAQPRGVLTSTAEKGGGNGLASGYISSDGFYGFSNDSEWTYTEGFYPQLNVFSNASYSNWGSSATASIVKNASKASASTVILDTWDSGYDWDSYGVRSSSEVKYNRTSSDYQGGKFTYDTVREIILDARVSSNTWWTERISGGAPTDVNGDGKSDGRSLQVDSNASTLEVLQPGLNWYQISTSSSKTDKNAGRRPIRLASLMSANAGADKTVKSGAYYDHKDDAKFTMLDTIRENLVVGADDSKIWSSSRTKWYPNNTKYYDVPLNMGTQYFVGSNTRICTEIWRAKKSGNEWVPDTVNVPVTDVADTNYSNAQKRWNGELPMYTDLSAGRTYIVRYYWKLKDGRYITDSKTVTVVPNNYNLYTYVRDASATNSTGNPTNNNALYLNSEKAGSTGDFSYDYPSYTNNYRSLTSVPYATNVAAAWKVKSGYRVVGLQVDMKNKQGVTVGTAIVNGAIQDGTKITIPVTYDYFYVSNNHEYQSTTTVNVTYTVKKDDKGGYRLEFNKISQTASNNETASAKNPGDTSEGIGSAYTSAYINDIQNNITVTLYVEKAKTLKITKQVDSYGDTEKTFDIDAILSTGSNGSGTRYSGDVTCTIGSQTTVLSAVNGVVRISLKAGETATLSGIPSSYYYYKVQETAASGKGYTVSYAEGGNSPITSSYLASGFPAEDAAEVTVTNTLQRNRELYLYKNVQDSSGSLVNSTDLFEMSLELSKDAGFSDKTYTGTHAVAMYRRAQSLGTTNITFTNGKASVRVPAGGYVKIAGLPADYHYRVTEDESYKKNYTVTYDNQTGQLTETPANATVTNKEGQTGTLTVSKEVSATVKDPTKTFAMDITLSTGSSGTGTKYSGALKYTTSKGASSTLSFTNGKARVTLADGESVTITGIPLDYYYTVQEASESKTGYTVNYTYTMTYGSTSTSSASSVTAKFLEAHHTKTVKVTNTMQTTAFTIQKKVNGDGVEAGKQFSIDIYLSKDSGYVDTSVSATFDTTKWRGDGSTGSPDFGHLTFQNGKATITLEAGQSMEISGVPYYYYYKVEEQSESAIGYKVSYENKEGQLRLDSPNSVVSVINTVDFKDFAFVKVKSENLKEGLSGAVFELYRLTDGESFDAGELIDTDRLDPAKWTLAGTKTSSPGVEFAALASGTYRLVETTAPDGRLLPKVQWNVIIEDGEITFTDTDGNVVTKPENGAYQGKYLIGNEKIYELPNSGGIGTYLFTIGGIAIMMTALLLFIKYKRKEDERG